MTPNIRQWSLFAALLLLLIIAPIKARQFGIFSGFGQAPRIFSFSPVSLYGLLAGSVASGKKEAPAPPFVFDGANLEAHAAIIWDVEGSHALFEKNANDVRPLASLTKLMTAYTANQIASTLPENERTVMMTPAAVEEDGDDGFRVGERFSFDDLRDAMLVKSSNDAAAAIAVWAESVLPPSPNDTPLAQRFVNEMNRYASEWGISGIYFLNPTGLDITAEQSGAYGSARDVAQMFARILKDSPAILFATEESEITITALTGASHRLQSVAASILSVPGLIGAKTGFTDLAGGNIVFGWSVGGRHYVVAVLGSTLNGRFSDALELYQVTMDFLAGAR